MREKTQQKTNQQTKNQKILLLKAYQHLQDNCFFSLDQNKVNLKMPVSAWQNLCNRVTTTRCKKSVYYRLHFFFRAFEGKSWFSHTIYCHQTSSCQITHSPSFCNEFQSATLQSGSTWRWSASFPEFLAWWLSRLLVFSTERKDEKKTQFLEGYKIVKSFKVFYREWDGQPLRLIPKISVRDPFFMTLHLWRALWSLPCEIIREEEWGKIAAINRQELSYYENYRSKISENSLQELQGWKIKLVIRKVSETLSQTFRTFFLAVSREIKEAIQEILSAKEPIDLL